MFAERTTHVWGGGRVFAPCRQDEAQQPLVRRVSGRGRRARRDQRASKSQGAGLGTTAIDEQGLDGELSDVGPAGIGWRDGRRQGARLRDGFRVPAVRDGRADGREILVVCRRGRAQNQARREDERTREGRMPCSGRSQARFQPHDTPQGGAELEQGELRAVQAAGRRQFATIVDGHTL